MAPYPLDIIPGINYVARWYSAITDGSTLLFGRHLLQMSQLQKPEITGSGDTLFDYVRIASILAMAFVMTCFGQLALRKQKNHDLLYRIVIIYARYYLGLYLLSYGFDKIFEGQFSSPSLDQLETRYGSSSPMGLLWTFMGYSKPYTVFTGILEIGAGALLFFRRTVFMGALAAALIMLNVVALNFCYDVPVKIFSTHLMLIAVFIAWPGIKPAIDFFIGHKMALLPTSQFHMPSKWMRAVIKFFLIAVVPAIMIVNEIKEMRLYTQNSNGPLNGVYKPASLNSKIDKMILENGNMELTLGTDSIEYCQFSVDTARKIIELLPDADTTSKYILSYQLLPGNYLSIAGRYRSDNIADTFKRKTYSDYWLVKHGVHWINDHPF